MKIVDDPNVIAEPLSVVVVPFGSVRVTTSPVWKPEPETYTICADAPATNDDGEIPVTDGATGVGGAETVNAKGADDRPDGLVTLNVYWPAIANACVILKIVADPKVIAEPLRVCVVPPGNVSVTVNPA